MSRCLADFVLTHASSVSRAMRLCAGTWRCEGDGPGAAGRYATRLGQRTRAGVAALTACRTTEKTTEKLLAARRAGLKQVILPSRNEKDLYDLPDSVREDLRLVFAERIEDVLQAAIPDLPKVGLST